MPLDWCTCIIDLSRCTLGRSAQEERRLRDVALLFLISFDRSAANQRAGFITAAVCATEDANTLVDFLFIYFPLKALPTIQ